MLALIVPLKSLPDFGSCMHAWSIRLAVPAIESREIRLGAV